MLKKHLAYLTLEINMPKYIYESEVAGHWDGEVEAKNKKEAKEKAEDEIRMEGLIPVGEMHVERLPKDEQ